MSRALNAARKQNEAYDVWREEPGWEATRVVNGQHLGLNWGRANNFRRALALAARYREGTPPDGTMVHIEHERSRRRSWRYVAAEDRWSIEESP